MREVKNLVKGIFNSFIYIKGRVKDNDEKF